mgnify:CR=1 FL=1
MNFNKLKIAIIIVSLVGFLVVGVFYLMSDQETADPAAQKYPRSVQNLIDNPMDKNDNWSTLIDAPEFQVSYSTVDEIDTFFITIIADPILESAAKAEASVVEKFNVSQAELCELPIVINIPATLSEDLSGYNFGLSFCLNRVHVTDVYGSAVAAPESPQSSTEDNSMTDNLQPSSNISPR